MNKLILCEGKTDAVLLGYYLGKVASWEHTTKPPKGLIIKEGEWFQKNDDFLLICPVGGKDNFKNILEDIVSETTLLSTKLSTKFEKIAFVRDRDDREIQAIERSTNSAVLKSISVAVENNKWVDCCYIDEYRKEKKLEVLLVVIPEKDHGALERVLLEAIAEISDCDRVIVEKTGEFAEQMRDELSKFKSKYLSNTSMVDKAHLSLTWAIQSPENALIPFSKQIRNVPWEKSVSLRNCFSKLIEI